MRPDPLGEGVTLLQADAVHRGQADRLQRQVHQAEARMQHEPRVAERLPDRARPRP